MTGGVTLSQSGPSGADGTHHHQMDNHTPAKALMEARLKAAATEGSSSR